MDVSTVERDLENAGYEVHNQVTSFPGDISHLLFEATIFQRDSGEVPVYKIVRYESDLEKGGRESVYGGQISLQREAAIYDLARKQGLPVTSTWGPHKGSERDFLVTLKPEGVTWKKYVDEVSIKGTKKERHFFILDQLGAYLARAHQVEFAMFGDVMPSGVDPHEGHQDYHHRLAEVVKRNLANPAHQEFFDERQMGLMESYFSHKLIEHKISAKGNEKPVLVLANVHRGDVYVDNSDSNWEKKGKIVQMDGFNFAQAAPSATEFATVFLQITDTSIAGVEETQKRLLDAYRANGGTVDLDNPRSRLQVEILTANHFLRAATVYSSMKLPNGKPDEMRREWGRAFKEDILTQIVFNSRIHYDLNSKLLNQKK